MAGVGETASLLTLVHATAILAGAARRVTGRFRNAPKELDDLASQLLILHLELEQVKRVSKSSHAALITDALRAEIESALKEARDSLASIEAVRARTQGSRRFSQRLRWAVKDQKLVNQDLARIRCVRERLLFALQILSCRGTSLVLTCLDEIKASNAEHMNALEEVGVSRQTYKASRQLDNALRQSENALQRSDKDSRRSHNGSRRSHNGSRQPDNGTQQSDDVPLSKPKNFEHRQLVSKPWSFNSSCASMGIRGSVIPTAKGAYKDYAIAVQVPLVSHAIFISFSMRSFYLNPSKLLFSPGVNLTLARLVDREHPFMIACQSGDLLGVRTMLQSGQGRVSDVTTTNWTPLTFAILSGNPGVVEELLDSGADVNASCDMLQTSPLQWAVSNRQLDIVRLLLSRGATQDHINAQGWNVPFFCWPRLSHGEPCMLDFLHLLAEYSRQDLHAVDTEGWTVLHRVAGFGLPDEVLALLTLGADHEQVAFPLRWNAIHHAVFYGNYAAFEVLIPHYGQVTAMTDERGWTLLHIAASAGHDKIVRHLLWIGADPAVRTLPFYSHMPESLFGLECTPREVAAAQGLERESQYLEALHGDLEFWEAFQHIR